MIKAVIFDLDNTLVDFMRVKRAAVGAAVDAMIDAGLNAPKEETIKQVFNMYDREGIEDCVRKVLAILEPRLMPGRGGA